MAGLRIAVIAGGLSLEREVSLRSGQRVAEALQDLGHQVTRLDVDPSLTGALVDGCYDLAYLALHGRAGEDGTVQGLLTLLDMPYTGPDSVASGLSWDKAVSKGMWLRAGLATPSWVALSADAVRDMGAAQALPHVVEQLGRPLIVKPAQGGGSMGVGYVHSAEDLSAALVASFRYHPVALIERVVAGTEVAVSVVGDRALPPVEIVPLTEHYDFAARYTAGAADFHAPARLDDAILERCRGLAQDAFALAGCRHVSRADMIVDPDGTPWLLELDTCPGMTETSLLPIAAEAEGWAFPELCQRIVDCASVPTPR